MMMLGMLFLWVLVIALVVWGLSWLFPTIAKPNAYAHNQNQDSLEILSERYARGQITRDEFQLMRHDILAADEHEAGKDDPKQTKEMGPFRVA
jgi:putative membrane protein